MTLPALGLYHDFRNPQPFREPWDRRYRAILEQIEWAERDLGFGGVWVSEHHFVEDGYAASTLTLAAAIAARTERLTIGTNVLVLPVHHPLRLAEDALSVDALSGGRFRLGVGMGYRAPEFAAFGASLAERRARFEEGLEVLRKAFEGAPFAHDGRWCSFDEVVVRPEPVRAGGPELWIGALSDAGAQRAGRVGAGFLCALPQHRDVYVAAGGDRVAWNTSWVVADDPERELARIEPYLLHYGNAYIEFGTFGDPTTIPRFTDTASVVASGLVRAVDGDTAARELAALAADPAVVDVHWWTVWPGEPVEQANERLEYVARTVVPRVQALLAQAEMGTDS